MTPGRLVHKSTDSLPRAAWDLMLAGFRARKSYRQIHEELAAQGYNVQERTIGRRALDFRSEAARREAFRVAATEGSRLDLVEEIAAILRVLDVSAGWKTRARRRVQRAVAEFPDEASGERAGAVKRELVRYRLEEMAYMQRMLCGAEGHGGEQLGTQNNTAGDAGGG